MGTGSRQAYWPAHLPAGALRVVRWSARYEERVTFYRDTIGLTVLETFGDSYAGTDDEQGTGQDLTKTPYVDERTSARPPSAGSTWAVRAACCTLWE